MNKSIVGVIMASDIGNTFRELTDIRSVSAIPVCGKYRAIDFAVSNMANANVTTVGVLIQHQFRSIMDHMGAGSDWDLDRRNGGLFLFPPVFTDMYHRGLYKGTGEALYSNIDFFKDCKHEWVMIAKGSTIYNQDYNDIFDFHTDCDADITIGYRCMDDISAEDLSTHTLIEVDEDNNLVNLEDRPARPRGNKALTGTVFMRKSLLIALLEENASKNYTDFNKDILLRNIGRLKIKCHEFKGYWRTLNNLSCYYNTNMDMLKPEIYEDLFRKENKIMTKVKDETPAKYTENAEVKNSIVADGCIIEGKVENSILFRGVVVKKGTIIKNSVIMQGTEIGENCYIDYSVLDKSVIMGNDKQVQGLPSRPYVIPKETIIR